MTHRRMPYAVVVAAIGVIACSRKDPPPPAASDAINAKQVKHFEDEYLVGNIRAGLTAAIQVHTAPEQKAKVVATLPAGLTVTKVARRDDWFIIEFPDADKKTANMAGWVSISAFEPHQRGAKPKVMVGDDCDCWLKSVPGAQNCDDVNTRKDCDHTFKSDCAKWYACMIGDLAPKCSKEERLIKDPDGKGGICVATKIEDDGDPDSWPDGGPVGALDEPDNAENPDPMPTVLDNP